ncbi:MAG TPA: carbonate dehydratase [Balneolaceae bacterium]|nr:carbonate dehydratase [Balneolaceae bacterium]
MKTLKKLFERNKDWAAKIKKEDPNFFAELSTRQQPEILWIGCSDSRVPANQIVALSPGDVFVHRNIANMVIHTDLNCLSVVQYAVEILKVKHIIVCGHYGCGGIIAAMDEHDHGLIDNWLRHIKDVSRLYSNELKDLSKDEKITRMCELNVIEQVNNICSTTIVQDAWKKGQKLSVHGWIYNLEDGHLQDLDSCISSIEEFKKLG